MKIEYWIINSLIMTIPPLIYIVYNMYKSIKKKEETIKTKDQIIKIQESRIKALENK